MLESRGNSHDHAPDMLCDSVVPGRPGTQPAYQRPMVGRATGNFFQKTWYIQADGVAGCYRLLSISIDLQGGTVVGRWQHRGCEVLSPDTAMKTTKKAMKSKAQKTSKQVTSTRRAQARKAKPKAVKTQTTAKVRSARQTREPKAQRAR